MKFDLKSLPDFSKKLVSINLSSDDDVRVVNHPHWENQGGRIFLVGTVPAGGSIGVCAVDWDQATDYLVFDSADEYRERLKISKKRRRK
jgi:hypothetical protein